jgi:hypothetical protein
VPVEGVVNALTRIHAALVPGGIVVDSQPVSAEPPVDGRDGRLGALDMREWARTIDAVDGAILQAVAGGLFAHDGERWCVVVDEFDGGDEFVEIVGAWRGTRIPPALAERARAASPPLRVHQDVRLRLLRALPASGSG